MKHRLVAIQFKHAYDKEEWGNKEYHYFTFLNDLEHGDLVVVETHHIYFVVKVIRYLTSSNLAQRYIIHKVDLDKHQSLLEKEMKLSYIQAEMDDRAEEIRNRIELEALAKEDTALEKL